MHIYYVKEDNYIFRFKTYSDLENLTGKSRKLMKGTLAESVKMFFPKAEFTGKTGALFKGWIDIKGNPVASLTKGNNWDYGIKFDSVESIKE